MKVPVIATAVALFCSSAFTQSSDTVLFRLNEGDELIFELNINTSFHGSVGFRFYENLKAPHVFLTADIQLTESERPYKSVQTVMRESLPISLADRDDLVRVYKYAMTYYDYNDEVGLDGSTWCLKSYGRLGEKIGDACFWTPEVEPARRGLEGLLELDRHLWEGAKMHRYPNFELY